MSPWNSVVAYKVVSLACLYESTESYCCHFDVGPGICVGLTLHSFTSKFFYVIGKALSGELSCMGTGLNLYAL